MTFLFVTLFLIGHVAYSALDMKPGLWKVDMVIKSGGKEIRPQNEIQKAMAKMPEARRKQMLEMMGEIKSDLDPQTGTQICYSKEMLDKPESFGKQESKKCTTKVVTSTPKKVVTHFKCEDGTQGDATWSVKSPKTYNGLVTIVSAKGEKSEISYNANFVGTDCGKVRPLL
jgi:hypothetical protein